MIACEQGLCTSPQDFSFSTDKPLKFTFAFFSGNLPLREYVTGIVLAEL